MEAYSDTVLDNNEPEPADDFSDTVRLDDIEFADTEKDEPNEYMEEMKFERDEAIDDTDIRLQSSINNIEIRQMKKVAQFERLNTYGAGIQNIQLEKATPEGMDNYSQMDYSEY